MPTVRVTEQSLTNWTQAEITNQHPWSGQENSAYTWLAQQIVTALDPYHQRTNDAAQLVMVTQELAAKVRSTLETAAWQALADGMAKANALAGSIITPHLPNRARTVTPAYNQMLAYVTEAVAEWQRWMNLSQTASDAITLAAQEAYNDRMTYAYDQMSLANGWAQENWQRAFDGAMRASTMLTNINARGGPPPTPKAT